MSKLTCKSGIKAGGKLVDFDTLTPYAIGVLLKPAMYNAAEVLALQASTQIECPTKDAEIKFSTFLQSTFINRICF